MQIYEQGDVLLFKETEVPRDLVSLGTSVIQRGESTGHAHRLPETETVYECPKTKVRYLKLLNYSPITHEEHDRIELPPGIYRIGIVREKDHFEEEIRRVKD